jgi:hypothetical protein
MGNHSQVNPAFYGYCSQMKAIDVSLKSVTVGTPVSVPDNLGDTWSMAWARDGDLYSPANDAPGFHFTKSGNIFFCRIVGSHPDALMGVNVNVMSDYRWHMEKGPDGCSWKSSGCTAVDGMLYLVVARHKYGEDSGDPTRRQPAGNASIIRSANGGKTWVRAAQDNYDNPMFPGSHFATPYFINYGQDGSEATVDQSDRYVYALSNDGFWDNGDSMILGRVLRSNIARLRGDDWQFFKQGDGTVDSGWTSEMAEARPVLSSPGHLGSTGAVYLPAQKCYLMIGWHYPLGGGKMPGACVETNWEFHTAPHPWGPWKVIGSHAFKPQGYYCPQVCPKFTSTDGSTVWAFTAGDWNNPNVYRLTAVPLTLQ